jgi:predicted enzyme related to lactoylglutathione lyase
MNKPAVVQFEITGQDSAALQRFYSGLFGWEIHPTTTPGYGRVRPGAQGISGAIGGSWEGGAGQLTVFVEVTNLHEALSRAAELGGQVIGGLQAVPQTGMTFAYVADPAGHVVGLSQGLQRGNDILWSNWDSHARRE